MRLRNVLKICLIFWTSKPQYAYKRYPYTEKKHVALIYGMIKHRNFHCILEISLISCLLPQIQEP